MHQAKHIHPPAKSQTKLSPSAWPRSCLCRWSKACGLRHTEPCTYSLNTPRVTPPLSLSEAVGQSRPPQNSMTGCLRNAMSWNRWSTIDNRGAWAYTKACAKCVSDDRCVHYSHSL